jgi:DNA topoisomerase-1
LEACVNASFKIENIQKKPAKRQSSPPFTTSTLQQEASRKLGYAVRRTMQIAQRLYEKGLITYMRTDSVNMSESAIAASAEMIAKDYGDNYVKTQRYKSKSGSAQEAHEAIRPTYFESKSIEGDRDEVRLYELIWKRAVASQMADALLEKTIVDISISTLPAEKLVATGEVMIFDGFLKLYNVSSDDDEEEETKGILPPLNVGQGLPLIEMESREKFTKSPARFTEASLVKKLEENGIGRPSTYAPTITKIMEEARGYVEKTSREGEDREFKKYILRDNKIIQSVEEERTGVVKNRLFPKDMGMIVTDFLCEHFPTVMDYSFTADIEEDFDEIADGKTEWKKMVGDFYKPFHEQIEKTRAESERATGERILGKHPENGKTVLVRMARYGAVVQLGTREDLGEENVDQIQYTSLQPGQSLESITFEEALEAFKLPKILGNYEGKEVMVNTGRFGPYIKYDEAFINIGRGTDPLKLEMEQAIEFIEEKKKADAPVLSYKGDPVTKGKGRFGPFLKYKGMFINIPRRFDPELITQNEMIELIEAKITKEANRYIHKWEDADVAVENGRWGPFIRFKKKSINLPKSEDGKRMTPEAAAELTLEEVKKLVEAEVPNAFTKKARAKKATAKKAAPKKPAAKKPAAKKSAAKRKK